MPNERMSVLTILASIEPQGQRLLSERFRGSFDDAVREEDRKEFREDPELKVIGENEHEMKPLESRASRGPPNEEDHLRPTVGPFETEESSLSRVLANPRDDLPHPSPMPPDRGVRENASGL